MSINKKVAESLKKERQKLAEKAGKMEFELGGLRAQIARINDFLGDAYTAQPETSEGQPMG